MGDGGIKKADFLLYVDGVLEGGRGGERGEGEEGGLDGWIKE